MTAGPEWPLAIAAGDGDDRLDLGDAAPGHTPIVASISFAGGAGDDRVTVSIWIRGAS